MENKDKITYYTYHRVTESEAKELDDYMKKLNEEPLVKKLTMEEIEENHKVNFVKDLEEIYKWDKKINQNLENKETVKTSAPTDKESDYTIYHKFVIPPIEKILEQPPAKIPPNHAADNRPKATMPGQSVKLTPRGKELLYRHSYDFDIHGVFTIYDIYHSQASHGRIDTRYDIIQKGQRLSFYDNDNVCLEILTNREVVELNNSRIAEKSMEESRKVNYRYQSVYGNREYYFDNDIVRLNKRDNLKTIPPQEKTQKVQKTALKGHKLTSMFRS